MTHLGEWRPTGGIELEKNALEAVTELSRHVVVTAGPGAGKTELLAQRADFLLRTEACPYPRRILAVSFKVDAARNLRERVRQRSNASLAARFDSVTFHAFAKRLIDNYRPVLTGYKALSSNYRVDKTIRIQGSQVTYDDLVPLAGDILGANAYARGGLRQTYSHVFLDEFQDCTGPQYQLLCSAFAGTSTILTAVGDTKQRIMVWAGALEGVMQQFGDDFEARPLPLYQNRRSAPRLRRMQNRMIAQMDPAAVADAGDANGHSGTVEVLRFDNEHEEARSIANLVTDWLDEGVPASEVAIVVRQQPHLVAAATAVELSDRGISTRNEQVVQDLTVEPIFGLISNFLQVIADEGQSNAYSSLFRVAHRQSFSDEDAARFDRRLQRMLTSCRIVAREPRFSESQLDPWWGLVENFLELISRPAIVAMSHGYQQGTYLDEIITQVREALVGELTATSNIKNALRSLSGDESVRIYTVHKCKGLEFEKVIILGVEKESFWGNEAMSEFFVAVSRAKRHLVLTHADHRQRPLEATGRWDEARTPYQKFLDFGRE